MDLIRALIAWPLITAANLLRLIAAKVAGVRIVLHTGIAYHPRQGLAWGLWWNGERIEWFQTRELVFDELNRKAKRTHRGEQGISE